MKAIINYTNKRLNSWYENIRIDYGVNGKAVAIDNDGTVEIRYEEDGVQGLFKVAHAKGEAIDYAFNIWAEMADIENDSIN